MAGITWRDRRPGLEGTRTARPESIYAWVEATGQTMHAGQQALAEKICTPGVYYTVSINGIRWGKSRMGAFCACGVAMTPGMRIWCIGPTYELADKVFGESWQQAQMHGLLDRERSLYSRGLLVTRTGSVIERKTADNPDSLLGDPVDFAIVDEASRMQARIWNREIMGRLADRAGRALIITSPGGHDWVYQLFQAAEEDPRWSAHRGPSWENSFRFPHGENDPEILARRDYYLRRDSLELFEQEYGASFECVEGRMFRSFRAADTLVDHAEALKACRRFYIGYDWGFNHRTVWLLVGRTDDDRWIALDLWEGTGEAAATGLIFDGLHNMVARNFGKQYLTAPWKGGRVYCDPSRAEHIAELSRRGWRTCDAINAHDEGIRAVIDVLPGVRYTAEAQLFADELTGIRRKSASHPFEWVKENDDTFDAFRYVVASVLHDERGQEWWRRYGTTR